MTNNLIVGIYDNHHICHNRVTRKIVHKASSPDLCNKWIDSIMYCKKVPKTCKIFLEGEGRLNLKAMRYDVAVYKSSDMVNPVMTIPWHFSSYPDRRNRYIMYNCNRYNIMWLD